jgi:hypothetical protein
MNYSKKQEGQALSGCVSRNVNVGAVKAHGSHHRPGGVEKTTARAWEEMTLIL